MNVRGGLRAGLAAALVLLSAAGLGAQQRFALVIGNANYAGVQTGNAVDDATGVAGALGGLGFEVNLLTDAGLADMSSALQRLGSDLARSPGAYGFFYFSGRGVQSGGANYLLPTDLNIGDESELKAHALACQDVLATIQQAGNGHNVVVLDASRTARFVWQTGSPGLAAFSGLPQGSVVVLSATPGSVTDAQGPGDGVFARALLKNLGDASLGVQEVFNRTSSEVADQTSGGQVPAVFGRLEGAARLAAPGFVPAEADAASRVGTTGPGGGIIFFDKGDAQDGWRYLEAAPEDLPEVPWFNGKDGVVTGAGATGVGGGRENTQAILAAQGEGSYAASVCAAYGGGGLHDWFLPSKDELAGLFQVLRGKPGMGFASRFYYYWSSSERNPIESWVQNQTGAQYPNLKGFKHFVRPIRQF